MTTRRGRHHANENDNEQERRLEREDEEKDVGDNPAMHARIIARRWLGSPPPTAERYARALRQWQALPGAVVSLATVLTVAAQTIKFASANPVSVDSADEESAP